MTYKEEFFDKLIKNIQQVADKLTTDGEHHLTPSIENTCHFASALHQTFCDVGDVAGMMGMGASCDFSPIEKEAKYRASCSHLVCEEDVVFVRQKNKLIPVCINCYEAAQDAYKEEPK